MRHSIVSSLGLTLVVLGCAVFYQAQSSQAATQDVHFSTTVQTALTLDITAGDTVAFGTITSGMPIAAPATGTIASVTTSAANGYTLGIFDGVTGSGSALLHSDGITRITDVTNGTIGTPVLWGSSTGLGITMYAADTNKEAKWGTGTAYNDLNNRYAAIPENATIAHTVTGTVVGANTSSWAFKLDIPAGQKAGSYTGTMTFTATAVLN